MCFNLIFYVFQHFQCYRTLHRNCLCLGQPDGSNSKKEGLFQNKTLLPKSTKSLFQVPIYDGLQSSHRNLHKSISVKARMECFLFSTQAFHSLSTDLIHQRQISESVQKYTASTYTIIPIAIFTESTSLLSKWQPINSSSGIVKVLCGTTFDFADNKRTKHFSLVKTFR